MQQGFSAVYLKDIRNKKVRFKRILWISPFDKLSLQDASQRVRAGSGGYLNSALVTDK